jgi:hypothetical protein
LPIFSELKTYLRVSGKNPIFYHIILYS